MDEIDYVKKAIKLGAEDYILKLSFTQDTLVELITRLKSKMCIRDSFWAGQMRRYPWCAGLKACPRTLLQGKMDGGPFGFRENWIFL